MILLFSGGVWLVVGIAVIVVLALAGCVTLAVLARVLSAPDREISVRIRVMPWPRVDIDAKAAPAEPPAQASAWVSAAPSQVVCVHATPRPDLGRSTS